MSGCCRLLGMFVTSGLSLVLAAGPVLGQSSGLPRAGATSPPDTGVTGLPDAGVTGLPDAGATSLPDTTLASAAGAPRNKAPASGLEVTIDRIDPVVLTPGRPLEISGVITNTGPRNWGDAQIYLEIGQYPAMSPADLEGFEESEDIFTTRIVEFGSFDEIGGVPAGTRKSFELRVPFDTLPIIGTPGVYNTAVAVLAGRGENRDQEPEAQARTLLPLIPADEELRPTPLVTMLPLTAPVSRDSRGRFLNDRLARELGFDGRLRNVLDFALQAPAQSIQVAVDPALHAAVSAMSEGYTVQPRLDDEPVEGSGQEAAQSWIEDFTALAVRQHVVLLPWGTPAASALAGDRLSGVVRDAVSSAQLYDALPVTTDVAGWEPIGTTRRGLASNRSASAAMQLVAESSLRRLARSESDEDPPAAVQVRSRVGPITAVVVRDQVAGATIDPTASAVTVRQDLMAEATVRAMSGRRSPVTVALPFLWDPGPSAASTDLETGLTAVPLSPQPLEAVLDHPPVTYQGRVVRPDDAPTLSDRQLDRIRDLRRIGRTYTDILTDASEASTDFLRTFALSGSSAWTIHPARGRALLVREIRLLRDQLGQVTVTTPTFVALSSGSGPFPVTISNALDVPVRVRLSVVPQNPALQVDAIDELVLEPGQQRDVQVRAHADGSGLTPVRVQLATPEERRFGPRSEIDVRATQIGLAIWIVMGVGLTILVVAAIVRIIRRIRSPGAFSPREEPRHP